MKKRAVCHNGHSLDDPANLILRVTKAGKETRECRTCANERFKRMRQSKKAKGSKTKEETVSKETAQCSCGETLTSDADGVFHVEPEHEGHTMTREVDPMDFLEVPAGMDNGPIVDEFVGEPFDETLAAVRTFNADGTETVTPLVNFLTAADLDAVVEEQEIAEKTANPEWAGIPGTPGDPLLPLGAPIPPTADCFVCKGVGFVRGAEEKLSPCPRCNPGGEVMLEDEGIMPVKAQVISQPEPAKPRRGCEHGYPNPMICPACKANGRR